MSRRPGRRRTRPRHPGPRHPGLRHAQQPGLRYAQQPGGTRAQAGGSPDSGRPDGAARRRRARIAYHRRPTAIRHAASCYIRSRSRHRPDPASTARASLGYSRVLAGRGSRAVASEQCTARQTRYLAVPTIPARFASCSRPTQFAAGQANGGNPKYAWTWPLTRWLWLADSAGWSVRQCRERRTMRGGSRHNSGRPRPRRPGTLHIPRPFRPVLDPV